MTDHGNVRPPWLAAIMAFETDEIERVHAALRERASRDVSGLSEREFLDAHEQVARAVRIAQAWGARFAGWTARRSRPELPGGGLSRNHGRGNASHHVQKATASHRRRRDQDPGEVDARTVGQMRADALMELCRHALGCKDTERSGVRTTVVVRMSLEYLTRGQGVGRVDGIETPVAVSELRRLAGDAGLVPEVLGRDGQVLDLGRTVRLFTAAQRLALIERDGGVRCHAPPEHCEAHHLRGWESGGGTNLAKGATR